MRKAWTEELQAVLERLGERPTVPGYRRESQSPPGPAGRADPQAGTARLFARAPGFRSVQRMQRPPGPGDAKGSESPTERFLGIPATLPAPPSERKNPKPSKQVARVPGTHSTRRFDRESGFCVSPLLPGRRAVILRAPFTARRGSRKGQQPNAVARLPRRVRGHHDRCRDPGPCERRFH